MRFTKEESEVRKQDFFMKTSYAYFKNCAFFSLRYSADFRGSRLVSNSPNTFCFFFQVPNQVGVANDVSELGAEMHVSNPQSKSPNFYNQMKKIPTVIHKVLIFAIS